MRTVDGRNLLAMTLREATAVADALKAAGLEVPTLVSPLLKWAAADKAASNGPVDFAFDLAAVLGASRIRVFSHLRYPGFAPDDLGPALDRLMDLAARHDVVVELENEPVCNLGSVGELADFFRTYGASSSRLHPLVDIANSYAMKAPPTETDIAHLAPKVDTIHLKDRDFAGNRTVPLGDGDIRWADELTRLLAGVAADEIVASIETHCPHDGRNATGKSVKALRRIAAEIGAETV
jgi:sugar phosphate isomerase/epimerase